jgi:hypothetical protein
MPMRFHAGVDFQMKRNLFAAVAGGSAVELLQLLTTVNHRKRDRA